MYHNPRSVKAVMLPPITMIEVSLDKAYEHAEMLAQVTRTDTEEATVFSGIHPDLGAVYIIVPAFGGSFMLPLFVEPINDELKMPVNLAA